MLSLSDNNQTVIIEAFNFTSRYLDDLLNIDNPYFEQMVGQIYPRERSGSVVKCLTRDRRAAGSCLTGVTALCP